MGHLPNRDPTRQSIPSNMGGDSPHGNSDALASCERRVDSTRRALSASNVTDLTRLILNEEAKYCHQQHPHHCDFAEHPLTIKERICSASHCVYKKSTTQQQARAEAAKNEEDRRVQSAKKRGYGGGGGRPVTVRMDGSCTKCYCA